MTDHERLCELLEQLGDCVMGKLRNDIRVTLARLRSSGPDGIRCVPVEPTAEMLKAAADYRTAATASSSERIYKVMLRAGGERD